MKYDLIIGIDPAGIGNNGIVIYSNETNNIIFNETFNTLTVLWTKNIYKEKFQLIKEKFINKKGDCQKSGINYFTHSLIIFQTRNNLDFYEIVFK
ncbi:hypothetical protein [Spiroplasma endosymbiont of Dactylopius coccus]